MNSYTIYISDGADGGSYTFVATSEREAIREARAHLKGRYLGVSTASIRREVDGERPEVIRSYRLTAGGTIACVS